MPIEPDTKDWTWVLERACPECGIDVASVPAEALGTRIRGNAQAWSELLVTGTDLARRPSESVWSPVEYACHVRDVHVLFGERLELMLGEDAPALPGWDQDAAAVAGGYRTADPRRVAEELSVAADAVATTYDAVVGERWNRTGIRSDGSSFTVTTLGRYHLHDVVHHLHDVSGVGA